MLDRLSRGIKCSVAVVLALMFSIQLGFYFAPAKALVKLDNDSINLALKYGMQNQNMGYMNLLGPNWIEGTNASLLNIYTPFMMIAIKAYKSGFPEDPTDKDIDEAKKRYARLIRNMKDPRIPLDIKFSVSMVGATEDFATRYTARIEGIGRGKEFKLSPRKSLPQRKATLVDGVSSNPYEAVNAYYFPFTEIEKLDSYTLILESPGNDPLVFPVKNASIY